MSKTRRRYTRQAPTNQRTRTQTNAQSSHRRQTPKDNFIMDRESTTTAGCTSVHKLPPLTTRPFAHAASSALA